LENSQSPEPPSRSNTAAPPLKEPSSPKEIPITFKDSSPGAELRDREQEVDEPREVPVELGSEASLNLEFSIEVETEELKPEHPDFEIEAGELSWSPESAAQASQEVLEAEEFLERQDPPIEPVKQEPVELEDLQATEISKGERARLLSTWGVRGDGSRLNKPRDFWCRVGGNIPHAAPLALNKPGPKIFSTIRQAPTALREPFLGKPGLLPPDSVLLSPLPNTRPPPKPNPKEEAAASLYSSPEPPSLSRATLEPLSPRPKRLWHLLGGLALLMGVFLLGRNRVPDLIQSLMVNPQSSVQPPNLAQQSAQQLDREELFSLREALRAALLEREQEQEEKVNLAKELESLEERLKNLDRDQHQLHSKISQRLKRKIRELEEALFQTGFSVDALLNPKLRKLSKPKKSLPSRGSAYVASDFGYVNPIAGELRISSSFGDRGEGFHYGVDIAAEIGTAVRTVGPGRVLHLQDRKAWTARDKWIERGGERIKSPGWRAGIYLDIKHPDNKVSRYLHLDSIAPGIEVGMEVVSGQIIGTVGRTAVEFSPTHLHFEMRDPPDDMGRYGVAYDPSEINNRGAPPIWDQAQALAESKAEQEKSKRERGSSSALEEQMLRLESLESLSQSLPLLRPVERFRVSSRFGQRKDPVSKKRSLHPGLDIPGPEGSSIYASGPGKVIFKGRRKRYGLVIEIDHGRGIHTLYGHLYRSRLKKGKQVSGGEKIGLMGSSGRSAGSHLHYELRLDGVPQDPMKFIEAGERLQKL